MDGKMSGESQKLSYFVPGRTRKGWECPASERWSHAVKALIPELCSWSCGYLSHLVAIVTSSQETLPSLSSSFVCLFVFVILLVTTIGLT